MASGVAKVIGSGYQFALATGGGEATAISYLPYSLATAGASDGRKSVAFALLGIANAWNTSEVPIYLGGFDTGLAIPGIQRLDCLGAVTAAYAEGVGACANILGTLDGRVLTGDRSIPELQAALTNPFALLDVFNDTDGVLGRVVEGLLTNQPLQDILTADVARLTVGGDRTGAWGLPNLVALTSTYGFQQPIVITVAGQQVTLFPNFKTGDVNGNNGPNYLALPYGNLQTPNTNFGISGLDSFTLPFIGNVAETLGLSSVLASVNVNDNAVSRAAAAAPFTSPAVTANTLTSLGVDGSDAKKFTTLTSDTMASRSATNSGKSTTNFFTRAGEAAKGVTGKAGDAAKSMTNNVRTAAENARTYTAPVAPKVTSPVYGTNSANTTPSTADPSQSGRTTFTAPKFPKFMGGQESDSSTPSQQQGGSDQAPPQNAPAPGVKFGGFGSGFKGGSKSFFGGSQQ